MWQLEDIVLFWRSVGTLRSVQASCSYALRNKCSGRSLYFDFYLHNTSVMLIPKRKFPQWSYKMKLSYIMLHCVKSVSILNHILPQLDWIWRDMENKDQKSSEYAHLLSESFAIPLSHNEEFPKKWSADESNG